MLTSIILAAAISRVPESLTIEDSVEVIEVNTMYDEQTGEEKALQLIFWDTSPSGELNVVDYLVFRSGEPHVQYDNKDRYMRFWDHKTHSMRKVYTNSVKVTHTFFDPESHDRRNLLMKDRRKLTPKNISPIKE